MAWSDKKKYQGKTVNAGTLAIMKAANTMLRSSYFGGETSDITLVQGSYSGGVSASAGTHNGGAAIDITAFNWKNREKVFRLLGVAMWHRPTLRGVWSAHLHGIVCGDGSASGGAKQQVTAYFKRRNGLANNGADQGYKMLVFPLFVNPEKTVGKPGVKYMAKNYESREQPTTKAKSRGVVKKGAKFTVVAVVNVNGTYWSVNPDGRFVPSSVLTKTAPKAESKPAPKPQPAPTPSKPAPAVIRPLTFNIPDKSKLSNATEEARVKAAVNLIKTYNPTVICFNELVGPGKDGTNNAPSSFAAKIKTALGSGYAMIVPTTAFNENYIVYNKAALTLVKQYPDEKIYANKAPGKHVTRAVFKDIKSGQWFVLGATHLGSDKETNDAGRQAQGALVMHALKNTAHYYRDCPIIVMGDMNIDADVTAFVKDGLVNARKVAKKKTNAQYGTYTNISKTKPSTDPAWVIDHIYVPKNWTVNEYTHVVNVDSKGNFKTPRPSDHIPVTVIVTAQ